MGFRRLREMNLAILVKQAWRLITKPNSLVARVYKSMYYPRCSFLEAIAGSNPSFIWRGILEAQNVVRLGYRRCIGDGNGSVIGGDPWLPTTTEPFVSTDLQGQYMKLRFHHYSTVREHVGMGIM